MPSNTHETVLKVLALVGASLTAGAATGGQSLPSFEVATAKLNTSGPRTRFRPEPGRLNVTYTTLRIAVSWAYDVQISSAGDEHQGYR